MKIVQKKAKHIESIGFVFHQTYTSHSHIYTQSVQRMWMWAILSIFYFSKEIATKGYIYRIGWNSVEVRSSIIKKIVTQPQSNTH